MRHFFLSLAAASAALLCGIGTAHAVPAKPGLIQVTQSDGTQLTVRLVETSAATTCSPQTATR